MESQVNKATTVFTEETFRSCYPNVSIQQLGDKGSNKITQSVQRRQSIRSPQKAEAVVPKTPVAVKTTASPRTASPKTPQTPKSKVNIGITPAKVNMQTPAKAAVTPKPQVAAKTPVATKTPIQAMTKGKVLTTPVPIKTTVPTGQVAKPLATPVKTAAVKTPTSVLKTVPQKVTAAKTVQNVGKQPNLNVLKAAGKPNLTAAAIEDAPDQSSTTVVTYHMPQAPQRPTNQLTIEKIEQQQRIPVVLDTNNQVVLRQVINSGQLVLQNRAAPTESPQVQSVVIGTSAQPATPVVTSLPQVEITTSEPLQALQVTQQVTLFRPKGTTFTVDDVKKQINLNKQSTMTNVVSSTTNSIPVAAAVPTQAVQPEQKRAVAPARTQDISPSPVRKSVSRPSAHVRAQQKPSPSTQQYPTTRGHVKKVSPKREIPMQKVSPLPPSLPPPELQFGVEEEVTTSEEMPPQQQQTQEGMKLILILPNGEKKSISIEPDHLALNTTLSDILQTVKIPMTDNVLQSIVPEIRDSSEHESLQDIDPNEEQWNATEHIGAEPGEILGLQDEMETGELHGESDEQQVEADESQKEADAAKSRKTKADSLTGESPKKKRVCRKKKLEEPVCLTISDDEEMLGLAHLHQMNEDSYQSDSNSQMSSCDKEPVITDEMVTELKQSVSGGGLDLEEMLDNPSPDQTTFLQCRTVRIGSYKVVPKDKVLITPQGLKVTVPMLGSDQFVELKILHHEIIKVLIHFGRQMPVLFFYTRPAAAAKIRKSLKMTDKNGYYYDSMSSDETHRRITFLPDKIDEDCKQTLKSIYSHPDNNVFAELTGKEANDILVKASPKEVQAFILKKQPNVVQQQQPFNGQNIQTIMVYPPPPEKGGIPINTEDYACLEVDQFLNDVIIDFYLKYVVEKTLSPEDRARTHVFSSFFYKRLTTKPPPKRKSMNPIENDPTASPAVKRHSRVKSWTKNVDLFSKDFIVIPINENSHWFLAIVCFPGLTGPVRFSDNMPIDLPGRKKKKLDDKPAAGVLSGKHTVTIGSTTITAVTPSQSSGPTMLDVGDEVEDRDEADGEDERMDVPDEDEDLSQKAVPELKDEPDEELPKPKKNQREPIKQPSILIFDSLAGASRSRVVATLRDYLRVEYEAKHGETRDFSGDVLKGTNVRCPQQTNYTDCGLYVLQYVEAFFKWPITDFHIPIMQVQDWFQAEIVSRKRYEIQQLLLRLMEEQRIDIEALNLPILNLRPEGGKLVEDYSGTEEEEEEDDDEQMCDEEEDEEMLEEDGEYNEEMEHEEMEEGEIGHHDEEEPDHYLDPSLEHEEHEMDEEEYGIEEEEEEEPMPDEELEDDKLEDISLTPIGSGKRKDLKKFRIPRHIEKDRMTDNAYKED